MSVCNALTQAGAPCQMQALRGRPFCYNHDPEASAARAMSRKLGGQRQRTAHAGSLASLPAEIRTAEDARGLLTYTLAEIIPLQNSIARARLLIALFDGFIKSLEVTEFEQRLRALEARMEAR